MIDSRRKADRDEGGARFQTTDWGAILRAQTRHEGRRRAAMGDLVGRYWQPVYCYVRRKGRAKEEAEDLTQSFFSEIVLGHGLIQQADASRGRFRNLLLTALQHYLISEDRAQKASKRRPNGGLVPLEGIESFNVPEPAYGATPDAIFNYAWASALLDETLEEVERQCLECDQAAHWAVFRDRVLRPILRGEEPPNLREVCARHGVAETSEASNMIATVKRRFQRVLWLRVRQFVTSDDEVEREIGDLTQILSDAGARS